MAGEAARMEEGRGCMKKPRTLRSKKSWKSMARRRSCLSGTIRKRIFMSGRIMCGGVTTSASWLGSSRRTTLRSQILRSHEGAHQTKTHGGDDHAKGSLSRYAYGCALHRGSKIGSGSGTGGGSGNGEGTNDHEGRDADVGGDDD
nr:hypothetical protein [Tanacetum cinerariifolium]